jgi:hypothetical protein
MTLKSYFKGEKMRIEVTFENKLDGAPKLSKRVSHSKKNTGQDGNISINDNRAPEQVAKKVAWQNKARIPLNSPAEVLVIEPPNGVDFEDCRLYVNCDGDAVIFCSHTHSCWEVRSPHSDALGANAPVTVNLTLAPDEPDE